MNKIIILIVSLLITTTVMADQTAVWSRDPINIVLPVAKEKMVTFPNAVMVGADQDFLNNVSVTNTNGTLYLTAKNSFVVRRVQVKDTVTNSLVLLNISAGTQGNTQPVTITYPNQAIAQQSIANSGAENYVALTRYAAQMLFAPIRLLPTDPTISQSPMQAHHTEPLLLDNSAIAEPLQSWQKDNVIVTAVNVRNQLTTPLTITPALLCGTWQAITFLPTNHLASRGEPGDSAVVFLVANTAFGQIMQQQCQG